ncbi:MAG TPA: ABC transporter ATP-binding protein [Gemmatimonadota bacterium]|nr:ABC transporter ATP-binding protein [Gemmatimonadota bacterium]
MTRVSCTEVGFKYRNAGDEIAALDGVSFSAGGHEIVSLVGPSGCGKTTLLKLLAGLLKPTAGRIVFEGDGTRNGRPRNALVFQDHGVFPWLRVVDNVAFGLEMQGVGSAERRERARSFLKRVGLLDFGSRYPHELSVGMRQRVGIARAFVSGVPVLLMDEPFGSLDAQTRLLLQQELLEIWQQDRKLVVFVTHDIEEAILLGDRLLVISGRPGRILEEIRIPLPRPRSLAAPDRPDITEVKWHIWSLLEAEARRQLSIHG